MGKYLDLATSPRVMNHAWRYLRKDPGQWVRGLPMVEMQKNLVQHIGELSDSLRDGSYRPQRMRCFDIDKADGGEQRVGLDALGCIVGYGNLAFSTLLLRQCAHSGVGEVLFPGRGKGEPAWLVDSPRGARLRLAQYRCFIDPACRLAMARDMVVTRWPVAMLAAYRRCVGWMVDSVFCTVPSATARPCAWTCWNRCALGLPMPHKSPTSEPLTGQLQGAPSQEGLFPFKRA